MTACHKSNSIKKSNPPMINRQLSVWYDVATLWSPYRKKINNIAVPHCFKVAKAHGIVVLYTKNFTEFKTWLPEPPVGIVEAQMFINHAIETIAVPGYGIADNEAEFLKMFGIKDSLSASEVLKSFDNPELKAINELKTAFHRICLDAIDEQDQRFSVEEEELFLHRYTSRKDKIAQLSSHIANESSNLRGYIFLIDHIKIAQENLPPLHRLIPQIVLDKEIRNYLSNKTPTEVKTDDDIDLLSSATGMKIRSI